MSRLKDLYNNEIVDAMTKKFGYANVMEVPKLDKIVINMGVGEAKENAKILENSEALTLTHSTAEVTMHSVSKSSSSSLRSSTIRLTRPEVWISFS